MLLVLGTSSDAQSDQTVIVFQPEIRFTVTAPNGWANDEESAKEMRLVSAFHPADSKWTTAPVVMYVNYSFKTDSNQTLESVMDRDVNTFKAKAKGVKVSKEPSLFTFPQGREARVISYRGGEFNNFEHVAYIDEGLYVVMFVIGARNAKQLENNLPAFNRMVQSYYDLSAD
ncbi:MAG: hypothetical protein Salg2KO_02400 [Salibacteraceae bacterium]